MKDLEGNAVKLLHKPNGHLLIWGRSGQGKTFFCQRKIEEEVRRRRNILILDYSGSYTEQEMKKNKFKYQSRLREKNPYKSTVNFMTIFNNFEDFCENLFNILLPLIKVNGYMQRKILKQLLKMHIEKHGSWNPAEFIHTLEKMLAERSMRLDKKPETTIHEECINIEKIIMKCEIFSSIDKMYIKLCDDIPKNRSFINILQLSDFPELQREFLVELITGILWAEVFSVPERRRYDTVVYDEMQFLQLHKGSALSNLLREGRKFGVSLILSTQFISGFEKEALETLLQAATKLIFRTTETDSRFSAGIISQKNVNAWEEILRNLQVGEAVLTGKYRINNGSRVCEIPIVCKIVFEAN